MAEHIWGRLMKKETVQKVAAVGCGVIGSSFALKFAMAGLQVYAYNRRREASEKARSCIENSLELLKKYQVVDANMEKQVRAGIHYTNSIEEAVCDAGFIQESLPESYEIKQRMLEEIEQFCQKDAIIASSSSGLLISEISKYAKYPERLVGGHPYNPPHLIPLIEITRGERTALETVKRAEDFYRFIGSEPVVLKKETLGFICNRLQMALYRELCSLVMRGVCSVEEADRAMVFGPGIRWAVLGPSLLFELGGGEGGIAGLMRSLDASFTLWYQDMSDYKKLPEDWPDIAQQGVNAELQNRGEEEGNTRSSLMEFRDRMMIEILKLHGKQPGKSFGR